MISLEARLEVFALLEVRGGHRLVFDALDQVIVHYVLSGEGRLETPGGAPVPLRPGSVAVLPAKMRQALAVGDGPAIDVDAAGSCSMTEDGIVRFSATHGAEPDLRVLCGSVMAARHRSYGLFDGLGAPLVEPFGDDGVVAGAFDLLRREVAAPTFGTRAVTGSAMKIVLVQLLRRHMGALSKTSPLIAALGDPKLSRAVGAVLEKPADPHTVASLAGAAGMSRTAFAQAFQGNFAMAPMEFVAKTRLHHAAELLRTTDLPVKVIAASIGFASRSHFSRAFRAAYGEDPRGWRKRNLETPTPAPGRLRGERSDFALIEEPG